MKKANKFPKQHQKNHTKTKYAKLKGDYSQDAINQKKKLEQNPSLHINSQPEYQVTQMLFPVRELNGFFCSFRKRDKKNDNEKKKKSGYDS
jgi:hypothetical protein